MNDRQETPTVNDITVDQESTVNISGSNSAANEKLVNLRTLERCLNEKIDKEMRDIINTVKDRLQNATLTIIDSKISP